jgi:2-polyprenyl-6-methoxyphenol hydroxylase-like FAD-dependent oxidoreductase
MFGRQTFIEQFQTDVLVVGAGPVGLALAGDLGWRGHRVLLVDKGDGAIHQPKMDLVGIRTMEFCRRWGIVDAVESSTYNRDYPQDNVYLTTLRGYELGRQKMPSMREEQPPPESPQKRERCPQNMFDPILRQFAESQPGVQLKFQTEYDTFVQTPDGVTAVVRDALTGAYKEIHARFLVGCDGAKSLVRSQLNIEMQGKGLLSYTTNVIFRCPNFNQLHNKSPGYRYMFVGPHGTWATIVAINGNDQWRMSIIGNAHEKRQYSENELRAFAHQALGQEFEMEILSVLPWQRAELVADKYGEGRVFICGDACHLTSPTGGLGMNTGIGDAVDLSWKLSAQLDGWGGPQLLTSYGIERRPIAIRITRFSTSNLETMKQVPSSHKIAENSVEGEAVRLRVGLAMSEGLKKEWFSINMHLGNRYVGSPINLETELEDEAQISYEFNDAVNYRPTTRVGCRAPHFWIADGLSSLDYFGRGFVLVSFANKTNQNIENLAIQLGIPLKFVYLQKTEALRLYEKNYVLVRPDGHVAWRGDSLPKDCMNLLQIVSGHGSANGANLNILPINQGTHV